MDYQQLALEGMPDKKPPQSLVSAYQLSAISPDDFRRRPGGPETATSDDDKEPSVYQDLGGGSWRPKPLEPPRPRRTGPGAPKNKNNDGPKTETRPALERDYHQPYRRPKERSADELERIHQLAAVARRALQSPRNSNSGSAPDRQG